MLEQPHAVSPLLTACLLVGMAACSGGKAPVGYTKIDDMEGGGMVIEWPPPPGMVPGIWGSSTDCTEGADILPPPYWVPSGGWSYAALPEPQETFPGVISTHAARMRTTTPLVGIWGASMGFDFAELPNPDGGQIWPPSGLDAGVAEGPGCTNRPPSDFVGGTVDLTAYSGFTFWGMADQTGYNGLTIELDDVNTDPRGGICSAGDPTGLGSGQCYNQFTVSIPLSGILTRYTVEFASLLQDPSWGYRPSPDVPDLQHVYSLNFQSNAPQCFPTYMCPGGTTPSVSFDLWIDDIYFINK
jgi:hypothetical protein